MMSSEHDTSQETSGGADAAITLLGRRGSPAAYAIRDFLHRSDVPYRWVELTSDEEAREKAQVSGLTDRACRFACSRTGPGSRTPTVRPNHREAGLVPQPVAFRIRSGDLRRRAGRAQRGGLRRLGWADHSALELAVETTGTLVRIRTRST
jgi:hypothetical protein